MVEIHESSLYREYVAKNAKSHQHAERARHRIPTGTSRSLLLHPPFPFYVDHAQGVHSTDLDGNQRLDFHNNYTTMIHGHGHPKIQAAVERQLKLGTSYSAPGAQEYELVEHLCNRIGSVEQVVFNNSGTEAVLLALRIARARTGRNKIGKFEGGYHGFSDHVMVGGHELPAPDDPVGVSVPTDDIGGLPAGVNDDVVLIRYNDSDAVREAVARFGNELAAIIVEPIQGGGGMIPAEQEFLDVLRAETERAGIILICDEVIALRHAVGGAQGHYGLHPDLTTMAKTIGGGFPIGAVGGPAEVMQTLGDPEDGGTVANLGTFSANPISITAGLEAMRLFDEAAIAEINQLGEEARQGLSSCLEAHGAPAQISGAGSLFQIHWTEASLKDSRGPATADANQNLLGFLGLCNRGVHVSMRGAGALSTPMQSGDIDVLVTALDGTLEEMKAEGWF